MRIKSRWGFKEYLSRKGVYNYEVAAALGVSESCISKRLRNADESEFEKLAELVDRIAAGKAKAG